MNIPTINISTDKQICSQCGKKGTGYFETTNVKNKYICHNCILKNIEQKSKWEKSK